MPRDTEGSVVRKGKLSLGKNELQALNTVDGKIPTGSYIFQVACGLSRFWQLCVLLLGLHKSEDNLEHVDLGRRRLIIRTMLFPVGSS